MSRCSTAKKSTFKIILPSSIKGNYFKKDSSPIHLIIKDVDKPMQFALNVIKNQ